MIEARPVLLLVDDEPTVRNVLGEIGRREGFEIIACASGADGLDVLRRRHVDLMFLDLQMPDLDGLGVLRATAGDGDSHPHRPPHRLCEH